MQAARHRELRLAIAVLATTLLASAGFDVAGNVAAALFPQEVRYADQIIGGNATAIDQGVAAAHRLQGQPLFFFFFEFRQIREGLVELGDGLAFKQRSPLPQQSNKGIYGVALTRIAKCVQTHTRRALYKVVKR